jgi:Methane oxygenase PmoA
MRALAGAMLLTVIAATLQAADPRIRVVANESARRVDVTIDGKPFTSYLWPATIMKPVLYPLRTATGRLVTRGFPLDPRKGERVDHPHHVGLWFNHGDVNGFDFWNNSDAIPKDQAVHMGTIHHKRIVSARSGDDRGELSIEAEWVAGDGKALLREQTQFIFRGTADTRVIDRYTTLTALDHRVVLRDNKESTLGIRLARELEQPSNQPEVFTDASGKATTVPVLDNTGVTGEYVSSEGKKGDAVWGTRGKWTLVGGRIGSQPIAIAILDHPSNFGYPTHWHARGYGLFAANPLGQKALGDGNEELNLVLDSGKSATFRYRVMILDGPQAKERVERESTKFASEHF